MIFIDKMKNMKIYKTPTFLPTVDGNKKKGSAAVLLTPNYNSSKKLMNNPMFVNKLRFQSYYLQKDVSYFVNSKVTEEVPFSEGYSEYEYLVEMTAAEKNKLKDTDFGLPGERKYPMPDAAHVKSAIKFFNYVDKDKEAELAKNIKAKAKKFGVTISVGKTNRLAKYVTEAEIVNESIHNNPVPVFFFKNISPDNILEAYKAVAKSLPAKVACKVHSGEFGNNNFLRPALWKPLIEYLDGTVVECNTAYEGSRNTTEEHKKTLAKHGWDKLPCEIMDEHGEVELDIPKYNQMNKNYVGAGLLDFNSLVVLSHFKGHTMGGFGGALKQLSIGCASARGKKIIHGFGDEKLGMDMLNSHTGKDEDINYDDQIKFTEAMADAASSVHEKFKDNVVYINVLANISKDCDCDSNAAAPSMKDIGILVSTDPVAIDKASIDLIYNSEDPGKDEIIERIESRQGLHIFDACKAIDFGTTDYRLIDLSMLRNVEKNTEKRIDEEEVEERFRYIPEWMNLNEAYDNVTTDYNLSRFGNANMIIVGEMHNRKMIEVWDNLLTKFKPEYWICEFADMDECLDDETLKDRIEHATNGSYDGKGADYQYNYWVYELALKHHVKLIGCNPIGKKFKTLDEEFKFREPYMLNTIKKYDKKRCLVQLGDGHLRSIPWSKELQDFSGNYKDDRGIVSDITVSFASPIWEYYHNKSGVKIIRWKHDYDIEKEFQSLNESSDEKLTDGMVFDLGGVLLKGLDWKEEIKKQYDYPDEVIDKVIKTHLDNFDESDTATIEDARFAFCSRFDESEREVAGNCYDVILRSWEPFDYVDDIIKLCKKMSNHLYYLSNWSRSGFETLQNTGKLDFLKEFDGGLVSYEVGFQKPDESIYKLFIEKMNIEDPANCIFFDDKEENVQAARSAGLSGVVFTSIGDIKTIDDIQNKVRPFGYVEEGYIKSEKDIYYNKDKFDSGMINLCFILGHSGSGKTTMAFDHTKGNEDKVDMYCLDDLFCIKDHFTMANLKEYGDLIYQFFNGPGKKYYITWEELKDSNIPGSEYEDKLYPEFVNFAKSYAKSHKDKKYIIEGVWLMEHGENKQPYFQPEEFKDYAFYIKGTSMLTSKFRAAKRDVQDIEDKSRSEIIKDFSKIFFKKWKFYTTDEKSLKKFRDYFSKLTPVNEHVTKKDEDYRSKGTIDLNTLKPIEVTEGIIQKYQDEYTFLKHIRTGENCKARMFKRQHGDQILCGVCVEEKQDGTKWIQALEVFYEFREYGLGRQLLDYAVTKLGAEYLSVSKKNEIAIQMYEDYGFKRYKETQVMYFYTLDPNCEVEDSVTTEQMLAESSDWFSTGDKIMFFGEDAKFDMQLKKMLFNDRIKQRKQLLQIYSQVKADNPFIKYTYADLKKYAGKNVFFDTYYYTNLFFQNNKWTLQKGLRLFEDYMQRLMGNTVINTLSYKKVTVFIPILDWFKGGEQIWNFRKSLNPISLIYQYMITSNLNGLKKIFSNNDVVFVGDDKYFKINFGEIESKDLKKMTMKFKMFTTKICLNQEFEAEDVDTSPDNVDSAEVIKAKLVDKIEDAKGVDLTAKVAAATAAKKDMQKKVAVTTGTNVPVSKATLQKDIKAQKDIDTHDETEVISKATLNKPKDSEDAKRQYEIDRISNAIDNIGDTSASLDDAMDKMDQDTNLKRAIIDLDASTDSGTVNISAARSARITELDRKLLDSQLNGRSIKDILDTKPKELATTEIAVASPNAEQWKNLSFVNFDKDYDIEKDIIRCFRFFENVSRPISIRNIEAVDGSTSEDRVMTFIVDLEDYRAKRFTIKLDIPIMKDNRFLLRGNGKSVQTQFFNMPILKVDQDVAEIISNYMKIRVIKYNTNTGKSLPIVARLLKAIRKYTGRTLKITYGDNSMICRKYDLPMDYIDLASVITKIETPNNIIYFSQDEIRDTYVDACKVEHQYSFYYNKKDKSVHTWDESYFNMAEQILFLLEEDDPSFRDLFDSTMRPTSCTFSKCKIMNAEIPTIVICGYHEGLRKTMDKACISYRIVDKLTKDDRSNPNLDWIKFKDGYVIYNATYTASILMNGLKVCATEEFGLADIDNRDMYLEFLDDFGGRIKSDGLDNFYDCMIDPMTKDILEFYKLPTDYVTILIYASNLLVDNNFHKHTDTSTRRLRRYELIASYTYKVLSDAYSKYANECKHGRNGDMVVKQSAVIDKFLSDTITSDDSCINALRDIETTNAITTKGPSGMNKDRAYSLDKRTYDDSMLNVLGMSTGFASNVGITRQATLNANIEGEKGFVKNINGDTSKMNTVSSLTAIESLIPFGTTHDDPMRTAMSFVQTAKHQVRTEESDPPLVVNGSEEAMPYISTDRFAYKAKAQGKVIEFDPEKYIILEYADGTNDYINLKETIEKNSDGGYYVPLKLDAKENVKVGMRVKEGDILAYDKYSYSNTVGESGNLAYNVGKLAKVAIINTDEGFEDSGVITEKMARSLATRVILKFDVILDKDTRIISNMKVGDHVEAGQALMVWQNPFEEEDANQLINTLSTTSAEVSELGKRRLTSEVTGTVTGIKMFRTVDTKDLTPSLKKMVDAYEKPIKEMADKVNSLKGVDKSIVDSHTTLSTIGKLKKAEDSVLVEYYVEYLDTVGIGDKIVYFAANKATEKSIIPLGKEPRSSFRPNETVDAFVSEVSIDKRIVTSTLLNGALNKLMIELDRSVKDILGIPYDDSKI